MIQNVERALFKDLIKWKESPFRKPLLLEGIRQVGKTWLLKEFGRRCYEKVAYFNFDLEPSLGDFFKVTKDPMRLIVELSRISAVQIEKDNTLVIFDEIQNSPDALESLKYFDELAPEYHIAAAGSYLGVALHKNVSFPVGRVDFLKLNPFSFEEFLAAIGDTNLDEYVKSTSSLEPIPEYYYNLLLERLRLYFITGGMPQPILMWTKTSDFDLVNIAINGILGSYERDFSKHPGIDEYSKITFVWNSIPSQLAKENKKFIYSVIKQGARAREYENALEWLLNAGVIYKVYRTREPRLPLSAYDDLSSFKIYLADVGLLRGLANLDLNVGNLSSLFVEFKGALAENYVIESLMNQFPQTPRYWSQINPSLEVDFLIQFMNEIIPIEVKSGTNVESKSLKKFNELYPKASRLRLRYSLENLRFDGGVLNIPLFLADRTKVLLNQCWDLNSF